MSTEIKNTTLEDKKEEISLKPGKFSSIKFEIVGAASNGTATFDDLFSVELERETDQGTMQIHQPVPASLHHRLNRYFRNGTVPFETTAGGAHEIALYADLFSYGPTLSGNVLDVRSRNEAELTIKPSQDLLSTFGGSIPFRVVGIEEPSGVEAYLRRLDYRTPSFSSVGEEETYSFRANTTRMFIRDPNGVLKEFDAQEMAPVERRVQYDDARFEGVQRDNRSESDLPSGGDFADFLNLPFLSGGNGPLDVLSDGAEIEIEAQSASKIYLYADRVDVRNSRSNRSRQQLRSDLTTRGRSALTSDIASQIQAEVLQNV